MMDQVIHIVTAATRQAREPLEEQRGIIERALKLGAKTYDGTCDPKAASGRHLLTDFTRVVIRIQK